MTKKTLSSKAYYVDTFSQHSAHEMFNSSLVLMCSRIFEDLTCSICQSSFQKFEKLVGNSLPKKIKYHSVYVVSGETKLKLFMRYMVSAIQNIRFLVSSPKDAIVIFPFNNLFSLRIINLLNKFLKRKLVIFCHGEMEGITFIPDDAGLLHRLLAKLSKNFFKNPKIKISNEIYFSVMGASIKKNLTDILQSEKVAKFITVDHPYIFNSGSLIKAEKNDKLSMGTVGSLNRIKGSETFVEFVKLFSPSIKSLLKFSVIGNVSTDFELLSKHGVDITPQNTYLNRTEFNKRISKLDFILFFYPNESYKITASGAIMDAVLNEKPILALNNDYFRYIFDKFGVLGYLFDNVNDMHLKVLEIMNVGSCIEVDFKKLKSKFTPEFLSNELAKELYRIGYLHEN